MIYTYKKPKKIKKSVRKENYLRLKDILASKIRHLEELSPPSVKIQRHKLYNINKAITVLFLTGIRVSELENIKLSDIDHAILKRELFVYQGKNKKTRLINISKNGVQDLREVFSESLNKSIDRDVYILHHFNNLKSGLSKGYITDMLNSFLLENLGDRYSSHSFRKGLINDLLERGWAISQVQKIIGHRHISTTVIYADELTDDERIKIISTVR